MFVKNNAAVPHGATALTYQLLTLIFFALYIENGKQFFTNQ